MRHTISVLVENKFGVLTRVAGLFSGRGYNIDSLNVAPTADPTASRMTIVTRGDDATLEQIVKQLNKLADVMKKHPNITKLRIEGHTDSSGKAKRNEKLSKARADAVAKWLTDNGVESGRLTTVGFGAKRPLVANDSVDHRALNRRTEYYVDEVDGKKVEQQQVASGTTPGGKGAN